MGASAVRRINDSTVITQADQDAAAASLKSQLCTGDDKATCDATIDAAVAEALPLTYEKLQADGSTKTTPVPAFVVADAAVQGDFGTETWTYSVVDGTVGMGTRNEYENGEITTMCFGGDGKKDNYTVGLTVQYGETIATAPLYQRIAKTPYTCISAAEYQQMLLQQMMGGY